MNDSTRLTFRCKNTAAHEMNGKPVDGNIVMFLGKNTITVRCTNAKCRSWTTIELNMPGMDLDLRRAGVSQSTSAQGTLKFESEKPAVIIDQLVPEVVNG